MDELAAKRRESYERERFDRVSDFLRDLFVDYRSGEIEGDPRSAVIVLIGDEAMQVVWAGAPSREELATAGDMIRVAVDASGRGEDAYDAVQKVLANRRIIERRQEERIAEYERSHPYICSHPNCRDRFKSKGALTRHERHDCRLIKYDREKEST